jgi:hypothetical protein
MWIWWIVSLVILIACIFFSYKLIVSSFDFLPPGKKLFPLLKNDKVPLEESFPSDTQKTGVKVNETQAFYDIQLSRLEKRLIAVEELLSSGKPVATKSTVNEEEDWKEMYYEENEAKQKVENELDITFQQLEEAHKKIQTLESNNSRWTALQSDYDARLASLQTKQETIDLMQRKLDAAKEREQELEKLLAGEIAIKNQHSSYESDYLHLQSELKDLKRQVVLMTEKEHSQDQKLRRLNELESKLALQDEEKAKKIAELGVLIKNNKMF